MWAIYINENSVQIVDSPNGHGNAKVYPYREIDHNIPHNMLGPFTYRIENNEIVGDRSTTQLSLENLQKEKIKLLNSKAKEILNETDYYITRWYETGESPIQSIIDYRESIRVLCNNKEHEIMAIDSIFDIINFNINSIDWPKDPRIPEVDPNTKI
jgi:hypothetical protein